jgi:hypothetical protein
MVKPLWEISMTPTNMATWRNLLMQNKNITERFTREFLTIDHFQNDPPCFLNRDHEPIGVKPQINVVVKIEENMNLQITLCWNIS